MKKREIEDFSTEQNRLIWNAIGKIEESILGDEYILILNNELTDNLVSNLQNIDLLLRLPDFLNIHHPNSNNKLGSYVHPDELFLTTLNNAKDNLLGSLSLLERYKSLKRCRHLINSWSSQRLETLENCISILINAPAQDNSDSYKEIEDLFQDLNSDAIKFQELYYLERQHIIFLDKQRCGNYVINK